MNITIMVFFLIISVSFLGFAYFYDRKNAQDPNGMAYVKLTAWLSMFIIFSNVLFSGVQYPTGSTETVAGAVTTIAKEYTTYDNRVVFFFLAAMSGIGFVMVFFDLKGVNVFG